MNLIIKAKMVTLNTKVQVVSGDITKEKVDVIVNAANNRLKHGGGVAGAILKNGGPSIQTESNLINFVETGSCAMTSAGNLPSKYIIHAVGPIWGEGEEERQLKNAVYNSLLLATQKKFISISLPAISAGIYGYPNKENSIAILTAIKDFLNENRTSLKSIRICLLDKESLKNFSDNFNIL